MSTPPTRPLSPMRRHDNSRDLADSRRNSPMVSEVQGDGLPPSSPSEYSHAPANNTLEMCNEIIERHDEHTCTRLKDEILFLMVVAGLFLAIVTAFTVESYKSLQEDKQDTTSVLLVEVVRLLNDTSAYWGKAQLPKPFKPNRHDIVVNQLWFLSLVLNLTAVAIGTFCLQWISAFSRGSDLKDKSILAHPSLALRTLRYEGLVAWGVLHAPEALLLMVQLSIGLFTSGLIYFLWNVNNTAAIPALVAVILTALVLAMMNVMPFLQSLAGVFISRTPILPQCPYKSPTSWLIQSTGNTLLHILKLFLRLLQPGSYRPTTTIVGRLGGLPFPFTDFFWKEHDLFCARLREKRSPYLWEIDNPPLRYYEQGLVSAIPHLIYKLGVDDLISTCLKGLEIALSSSEHWEEFFRSTLTLSKTEKDIIDNRFNFALNNLPQPGIKPLQQMLNLGVQIKNVLLKALVLQHLSQRIPKLATLLIHHRVELYIQFNSLTTYIDGDNEFGKALKCPLKRSQDAHDLPLDLKRQFLECVCLRMTKGRQNDDDVLSAFSIVQLEVPTVLNNNEEAEAPSRGESAPQIPSSPNNSPREENSEPRADITRLCSQMREMITAFPESSFQDKQNYNDLRKQISCAEPDSQVLFE